MMEDYAWQSDFGLIWVNGDEGQSKINLLCIELAAAILVLLHTSLLGCIQNNGFGYGYGYGYCWVTVSYYTSASGTSDVVTHSIGIFIIPLETLTTAVQVDSWLQIFSKFL